MAKALGFLVDGIPMCCKCAEWYAHESGYPNLFFAINPTVKAGIRRDKMEYQSELDKYKTKTENLEKIIKNLSDKIERLEKRTRALETMECYNYCPPLH